MPDDRPILVVGATGRIGRPLVTLLRKGGAKVRVLLRDPGRAPPFGPDVEVAPGDLDDPASLSRATGGARAMYLASGVGAQLVEQHARAIEAARAAGVEHVARVSTEGVEHDNPMLLARWHRAGEAALEASGMAWTHLRPCNFMHNMLSFVPSIAARGEIRAPFGNGRMTLVDVGDIAAVAAATLLSPGHRNKAYKITGAEWLSYADIAKTIAAATGRPVRYAPLTEDEARRDMAQAGYPDWLADDLLGMYALLAQDRTAPVTAVVRDVAGREPRRFADFAREHAAAFTQPAATRTH